MCFYCTDTKLDSEAKRIGNNSLIINTCFRYGKTISEIFKTMNLNTVD